MNVPKTYFSTKLHTGHRVLRRRLEDLFAAPRRRGVFPLVCALLLVSMLGSLVACDTAPAPQFPAFLPPAGRSEKMSHESYVFSVYQDIFPSDCLVHHQRSDKPPAAVPLRRHFRMQLLLYWMYFPHFCQVPPYTVSSASAEFPALPAESSL